MAEHWRILCHLSLEVTDSEPGVPQRSIALLPVVMWIKGNCGFVVKEIKAQFLLKLFFFGTENHKN